MKDKRGILRGQCTQDGCDCMDFEADETQTICAYCGHFPPMHKNLSQQQGSTSTVTSTNSSSSTPGTASPSPTKPWWEAGSAVAATPAPTNTAPLNTASQPVNVACASSGAGICPVCMCSFSYDVLPTHAASCKGAWPVNIIELLLESLPKGFPAKTVENLVSAYQPMGDIDGVLALLLASADQIAKPAPAAVDPDPATMQLIMDSMIPEKECEICFTSYPVTKMFTINCPSSHRFCFECVTAYIEMRVKENLPVVCPDPALKCTYILSEEELWQVANLGGLSAENVMKYDNQLLLRAVKNMEGAIACPTPNCPNWVIAGNVLVKQRCDCQACNASFCSLCKKPYHYSCTCAEVVSLSSKWMEWCLHGRQQYNRNKVQALDNIKEQQEAIDKRNEELRKQFEAMLADEKYKEANGKLCPRCNRVIIKEGGCDSMVCGRDYHGGNVQDGCGNSFNWSKAQPYVSQAGTGPKQEDATIEIPDIVREKVHNGITCDACKEPIKGLRITCVHCPAVDFCESCEVTETLKHKKDHIFKVLTSPD